MRKYAYRLNPILNNEHLSIEMCPKMGNREIVSHYVRTVFMILALLLEYIPGVLFKTETVRRNLQKLVSV